MKLSALLLNFLMILTLTGCGANPAESKTPSGSAAPQTEQPPETGADSSAETENAAPADGGTAVVYFSATGTTERVALEIAELCGAEVFEITPQTTLTTTTTAAAQTAR